MAALLALASALAFGISDFSGGLATRRSSALLVVLVSNGLSLVLATAAALLIPGSTPVARDMLFGAAAGAAGLVGVLLLYRGLAMGPMSIVAPLTAVLSALIPVLFGVAGGERPGPAALLGIAVAVPAIALISRQPEHGRQQHLSRRAVIAALGAGIGFGTFYVLLAQTSSAGVAWPLVGQRGVSVGLLAVVLLVSRAGSSRLVRGTVVLALLAGLSDFAANLAYLTATHLGLLALVAVLSSFYPATTVLLAGLMLRERLSRPQAFGLLLAVAAVALIAVR